jgi:hypothetical protein
MGWSHTIDRDTMRYSPLDESYVFLSQKLIGHGKFIDYIKCVGVNAGGIHIKYGGTIMLVEMVGWFPLRIYSIVSGANHSRFMQQRVSVPSLDPKIPTTTHILLKVTKYSMCGMGINILTLLNAF